MDQNKDQSYVLFTLKQKELQNLLLPVGEFNKEDINFDGSFKYPADRKVIKPNADDVYMLCYTSGTTGNPKAAKLTERMNE